MITFNNYVGKAAVDYINNGNIDIWNELHGKEIMMKNLMIKLDSANSTVDLVSISGSIPAWKFMKKYFIDRCLNEDGYIKEDMYGKDLKTKILDKEITYKINNIVKMTL